MVTSEECRNCECIPNMGWNQIKTIISLLNSVEDMWMLMVGRLDWDVMKNVLVVAIVIIQIENQQVLYLEEVVLVKKIDIIFLSK